MKIEFCEHNKGKMKVINKIEENYPNIKIEIKKCIEKCSLCQESSIVKVDGKLIKAKKTEELYKKISRLGKYKNKEDYYEYSNFWNKEML